MPFYATSVIHVEHPSLAWVILAWVHLSAVNGLGDFGLGASCAILCEEEGVHYV